LFASPRGIKADEPAGKTWGVFRRYVHALAPLAAAALWGGMCVVAKWGLS